MAAPTTDIEIFAEAPPPEPPRPRVLLVGSVLTAGAAAMVVLALVAVYLRLRSDVITSGETWLPDDAVLPLSPGNMAMVSLLMSAVTVAWAVYALRNDDRSHAYLAFGVSMVLAAGFVVDTVYLWTQLTLGIRDSVQALLIYTITGAHLAMVAGGMLFLTVMAFRALGGQLTGRAAEGLNGAAAFWYVTIGVYAVIWYAIYITK